MTQSIPTTPAMWETIERIRQGIINAAPVRKPRVLIVDDNENDAEILKLQVENECVPSDIAVSHSCEEAIKLLDESKYDVVFLDLRFPGKMSGTELMNAVGSKAESIPFVVLTGLDGDSVEFQGAFRAGAMAIFPKPLKQNQVRAVCGMVP